MDLPPTSLGNQHDDDVCARLAATPIGKLAVDKFSDGLQLAPKELRDALHQVYCAAARRRRLNKANKEQLKLATAALNRLNRAIENLDKASVKGRGLDLLLTGQVEHQDVGGEHELNQFASSCFKIKLDITNLSNELHSAIRTETNKRSQSGNKQRRLRTLVEELANWFESRGLPVAPTVDANRRDGARAVVHGRRGSFLDLARALLCKVDSFRDSKVEAAVTNVHEARLRRAGPNAARKGRRKRSGGCAAGVRH